MSGFTLLALVYVCLIVFVTVTVWRTVRLARLPVHLRWELAPVPHEKGKSHYGGSYFEDYEWWTKPRERSLRSELVYMFEEIVFIKALWKNNRRLWWFSFPFHFGMYLLIVAAGIVLVGAVLDLTGMAPGGGTVLPPAILGLTAAGHLLGVVGAVGLLGCRIWDPQLRPFRTNAALFNLGFLLLVFLSGLAALVATNDFAGALIGFARALLTGDGSTSPTAILRAHLVLVSLFAAYLPFTRMLHFVAKYFTYHKVRWDDSSMVPGSPMEKQVLQLLEQPVTWSAAHLQADGRKNWIDIANNEGKQ
ncbi:MAG: respiratory nitrate reductase subunit gamma [Isosphaeraceae bacterium]